MSEDTEGKIVFGLPSASFLPLAKYKFKHLTGLASLTIPVRGSFPEGSGFSGEYDICPSAGIILFGTLTQVMLGLGKYPNMENNQRFILSGLELDGDNLTVIGRVVELLEETDAEASS